jgi:hypothetical protein
MYTRNVGDQRVYWQGPSFGFDYGVDGDRTMIFRIGANRAVRQNPLSGDSRQRTVALGELRAGVADGIVEISADRPASRQATSIAPAPASAPSGLDQPKE